MIDDPNNKPDQPAQKWTGLAYVHELAEAAHKNQQLMQGGVGEVLRQAAEVQRVYQSSSAMAIARQSAEVQRVYQGSSAMAIARQAAEAERALQSAPAVQVFWSAAQAERAWREKMKELDYVARFRKQLDEDYGRWGSLSHSIIHQVNAAHHELSRLNAAQRKMDRVDEEHEPEVLAQLDEIQERIELLKARREAANKAELSAERSRTDDVDSVQPSERPVALAPGVGMAAWAKSLFSSQTVERVFEPLVADYQHEFIKAIAGGDEPKARRIQWSYRVQYARAMAEEVINGIGKLIRTLRGAG